MKEIQPNQIEDFCKTYGFILFRCKECEWKGFGRAASEHGMVHEIYMDYDYLFNKGKF